VDKANRLAKTWLTGAATSFIGNRGIIFYFSCEVSSYEQEITYLHSCALPTTRPHRWFDH